MKFPQLTFTRFIAAMGIVFLHYAAPTASKLFPAPGTYLHYINSFVSYFFLLSGFILVVSSSAKNGQSSDRQFWLNRFARVYPLYLFAFLLTAVIVAIMVGPAFLYVGKSFIRPALSSILLMHAWIPDYAFYLNYPSWSLSVEMLFYALFPFLFRVFSRLSSRELLLVAGSSWLINQLLHTYFKSVGFTTGFTNAFPVFHLATFVMGVCLGIGFVRHTAWLKNNQRLINYGLFITLLVTGYLIGSRSILVRDFEVGLFAPLFALLILYLCTHTNKLVRLFSQPRAVYLGEISYGVYILQAPVAMLVRLLNVNYLHGNVLITFPMIVIVLLLTSVLCYERIEKPCRHWLRRTLLNKPAQSAAIQQPVEQMTQ